MAISDTDRQECRDHYMRRIGAGSTVTKTILRNSVNATDNWLDANLASLNAALPPEAQSGLTLIGKTRLLIYVLQKRAGLSLGE